MNIFVAKLHYAVTEQELKQLFERFGTVSNVKIIFDRETQRSKGYGFIEMPDEDEAAVAIEELNNFSLHGRNIVVKKSTPNFSKDRNYNTL